MGYPLWSPEVGDDWYLNVPIGDLVAGYSNSAAVLTGHPRALGKVTVHADGRVEATGGDPRFVVWLTQRRDEIVVWKQAWCDDCGLVVWSHLVWAANGHGRVCDGCWTRRVERRLAADAVPMVSLREQQRHRRLVPR
jgi:hypothetical protein